MSWPTEEPKVTEAKASPTKEIRTILSGMSSSSAKRLVNKIFTEMALEEAEAENAEEAKVEASENVIPFGRKHRGRYTAQAVYGIKDGKPDLWMD